ncbi:MAG: HAD family hydrolase [Pseudomonadota bacterium]
MITHNLCVVFDVDDTLYLERDYVRSGFYAVGLFAKQKLGSTGFFEAAWAEFEAGQRGDIFDLVLSQKGLRNDNAMIAQLVEVYRYHVPQIALFDDAFVCLNRLRGAMYLAAITDGPLESQKAKVKALGLEKWTNPTIFTAALGPKAGKPNPMAFELVQEKTHCKGSSCVYVGDNPSKDFVAPKSLGWRTVRLIRPGGLHANEPSGDDVDIELPDLDELEEHLGL